MVNLTELRETAEAKRHAFESLVAAKFPGFDHWHWSRARAAMRGDNVRRNDDTSRDAELAADADIGTAHAIAITALHAFYSARDGERGFLGSRGA